MKPIPDLHRGLTALLAVLALLLLAASLGRWLVASQLSIAAADQTQRWQQQSARWQWSLQRPQQLLAGRVFGPATAQPSPQGLQLQANSSAPYQLGLRLRAPVDLQHWPRLRLDYHSRFQPALGLIAGPSAGPVCYYPLQSLPAGNGSTLNLQRGDWHRADGTACQPGAVQLLRLMLRTPPGQPWQLRQLSLWPASTPGPGASPRIELPAAVGPAQAVLAAAWQAYPEAAAPRIALAAATSTNHLLQLRDTIRGYWPGALIAPTPEQWPPRLPPALAWLLTALYLAALPWLPRQPAGRWRDGLELVACLAGPLWLVVGMHYGASRAHWPSRVAAGGGLGWALWLAWQQRPWPRPGRSVGGWLRPQLLLLPALLLARLDGGQMRWPGLHHVLGYGLWALLQQGLLLGLLLPRLQRLFRAELAAIIAAGLFMLMHSPNSPLMQCCLLAELYWLACWRRDHNLLAIALAHAAAALIVQAGLNPQGLIRSLEVSARFLN